MESEPAEFSAVRRLLALKRHETPPPGFFVVLPEQIRARIERQTAIARLPWWERWVNSLAWRPALAGTCALCLVSLVVWRTLQNQPQRVQSAPALAQDDRVVVHGLPRLQPVPGLSMGAFLIEADADAPPPSVSPYFSGPRPPEGLFRPQIEEGQVWRALSPAPPLHGPPRSRGPLDQ